MLTLIAGRGSGGHVPGITHTDGGGITVWQVVAIVVLFVVIGGYMTYRFMQQRNR